MDQIIDFRNSGDFFDGTNLPLKAAYKLNKIRKAVKTKLPNLHFMGYVNPDIHIINDPTW